MNRLTAAQQQWLEEWRLEWWRHGVCTDPADRPRAEAAISALYRLIDQEPPRYLWVDGPACGMLAIAALRASLGDSLSASLWASLSDSLRGSLRESLWASLGDSLRASLSDSLRASLGDSLSDSLRASLGDSLSDSLRDCYWGQHGAYWIAQYAFCQSVLGVRYAGESTKRLGLWSDIAQSCAWWWPYQSTCIISDRPLEVHMDQAVGALHNENGPSVLCRDGWAVYALHGVRVPEWLVTTSAEQIDPRKILTERNAQIRATIVSKVGIERVVECLDAKVLDRFQAIIGESVPAWWPWPVEPARHEYELLELRADIPDLTRRPRYLRMTNPSTGQVHVEGVPFDIATCREALRWRSPSGADTAPVFLS